MLRHVLFEKRHRFPVACQAAHNGNKACVLSAIRDGCRTVGAICDRTGLNETQVRNAIKRLIDSSDVRRGLDGGYVPARPRCLLAEVWR